MPEQQEYAIEFIAGGVVKDAAGNVINDDSERVALAQIAFGEASMEAQQARSMIEVATARVIQASMEVAEAVALTQQADAKAAEASVRFTQVKAEVEAAQREREEN